MTSNDLAKPDKNRESTVIRTSNNRNKNILKAEKLDLCMRVLKLTMSFQRKFFIILTYKWV